LPGPLQSIEDLEPVLGYWKGAELRLCGPFALAEEPLHRLADDLHLRGIRLAWLDSSSPTVMPVPVPATTLDLRLWQARLTQYLILRGLSERFTVSTTGELPAFFAHLHAQGIRTVVDLTPGVVQSYRLALFYAHYRGRRLSLLTQSKRIGYVKAFTRFLCQDGWTLTNAGADVPPITAPRRLPRVWLSEAEVATLLESPPLDRPLRLRNRALLELFYGTALRNSEMCGLHLDALDLVSNEVRVRYGKGGKSRLVPVGDEARRWLLRYLDEVRPGLARTAGEAAVFLTARGEPFCRHTLAVVVRHTAHAAGLQKTVTPHVLRHACATHMLRRGASLRHVQELLGHASPSTTQLYTRVDIADLHAVHARFHPRGQA
jgi:integrase/recombinase XerD